jgi:hypothetical protein
MKCYCCAMMRTELAKGLNVEVNAILDEGMLE